MGWLGRRSTRRRQSCCRSRHCHRRTSSTTPTYTSHLFGGAFVIHSGSRCGSSPNPRAAAERERARKLRPGPPPSQRQRGGPATTAPAGDSGRGPLFAPCSHRAAPPKTGDNPVGAAPAPSRWRASRERSGSQEMRRPLNRRGQPGRIEPQALVGTPQHTDVACRGGSLSCNTPGLQVHDRAPGAGRAYR